MKAATSLTEIKAIGPVLHLHSVYIVSAYSPAFLPCPLPAPHAYQAHLSGMLSKDAAYIMSAYCMLALSLERFEEHA